MRNSNHRSLELVRNVHIDGTEDGVYQSSETGEGQRAPWVVFDEDRQCNIAGPFRRRAQAEAARREALQRLPGDPAGMVYFPLKVDT